MRKHIVRLLNLVVVMTMVLTAISPVSAAAMPVQSSTTQPAVPDDSPSAQAWGDFIVSEPTAPIDTTGLPLAQPPAAYQGPLGEQPGFELPKADRLNNALHERDTALKTEAPTGVMPPPLTSWDGIPNTGVQPPDTDGQVGPNHYVQIVNSGAEGSQIRVWNKSGTQLYDYGMNSMWPAGSRCNVYGYGDPVVLYDQLADRWLLTQFTNPPSGPYNECIAVSKTPVPTNNPNDWWLYMFDVHPTNFPDYPKFGVWPDGYYMMAHQFANGSTWAGTGVWVFDRDKMLLGQPATFQYKDLYPINPNYGGMLPSNLMGDSLPPAGSPNYYAEVDQDWSGTDDVLTLFAFHTDWATPANTTFSVVGEFVVAPFDMDLCSASRERCIDQPGRPLSLEAISDRLMMHLWYRNFGDHEALVTNHTVDADGAGHAGIRWYELRKVTPAPTAWSIYQQGTYFPDSDHRWMGSIAMDHVGNIALGYSVSSLTTYPSVRYAGRLASDPLGTLPQTENSIVEGGGSFSGYRWGDYSAMSVDPVDDCSFWYTQEYVRTGETSWSTRVGSFKFPSCSIGPQGILSGTVSASGGGPIANAAIQATASVTETGGTTSAANGSYSMNLLVGTYVVTATAYGYLPQTANNVVIDANTTTVQNFTLTAAPAYTVSGTVRDGLTGWPLYAKITIDGYPGAPIWTDPATGQYSLALVAGTTYNFNVATFSSGYVGTSRSIGPLTADQVENFDLYADQTICTAPGYYLNVIGVNEPFDATTAPAGWTSTNNGGTCSWVFNNPGGRSNLTGGSGNFAIADSDACGSGTTMSTTLTSPAFDVSSLSTVNMEFKYDYYNLSSSEVAAVDISADNGTTWTNLFSWNSSHRGPATYSQDVSSLIGGATQAKLRWRYGAPGWDWWWELDDVFVGQKQCLPRYGGLVVGSVSDGNSSTGLLNAKVENQAGFHTLTVDTPADPAEPAGFYTLFSPAGTQVFTATKSQYGPSVANVSVPLSGTVRQDFTLYSGHLSYTPAAIDVTFMSGMSTTLPVTVSNTGLASAHFEIQESDQGGVPYIPTGTRPPFKPRVSAYSAPEEVNTSLIKPLATGPVVPNTWGTGASIPTGARYRSAGTTCDGKDLYVFGGQNASAVTLNESWKYDSAANTWTALAAMPTSLMSMEAECYQGMIYLVGGYTGSAHTNSFLIYNTATNTWTSSTWPATRTPMTAIYGTTLYAFGGNPGPSSEVRAYDILAGTWSSALAAMPTASTYGAAVTAGNYIFVVGGASAAALDTVQRYDPVANTWATGPALPNGRMNPTTAWYGNRLYVAGGGGSGGDIWTSYSDTYYYDLTTWPGGSWTNQGETIPTPVLATANACINNRIYAATGTSAASYYAILQYLDDGQTCHVGGASVNVPWISEVPISATVAAAGSQLVNVTVDSASVAPGIYRAALKFDNDTPYPLPNLPVTMTVTVPPTWGKLTGNVSTLGYCDANPASLENVTVTIQSALNTWNVATDMDGNYSQWVDVSNNPLTVTVAPAGYSSDQATGVTVFGQGTTTRDFMLRSLQPCVTVSPPAYTVTLNLGQTTTRILRTNNGGGATAVYSMTEENVSSPQAAAPVILGPRSALLSSARTTPNTVPAAPWRPDGTVNLVVDDGSAEDSIGLTSGGQFVWLNRFTPVAGSYPFRLTQVQALFNNSIAVGANIQIVVWQDKDGDGNPGTNAQFLYSQNVTVQSNNLTTWNVYNLTTPPLLTGPGDVLIGMVNRSGVSGLLDYPAAIDETASQGRSWIGAYAAGDPPSPPTLPADSLWGTIDSFGLAGNWTLRGVGQTGGGSGDVVWLTETPVSGTIPSDSFVNTTIGFNANAVALPGTYKANVNVNSNDTVNPVRQSAMTMIVNAPANWGVLTGTVYSLNACGVNPTALPNAQLVLQGTVGPTRTVTTDGNGRYSVWLDSLTGPYTLSASAANHLPPTPITGIVINQLGAVTVQNVTMQLIGPCLSYAPPSVSVTVPWGGSASKVMTLTNSGLASSPFTITEQAGGFFPLLPEAAKPVLVVSGDSTATRAYTTALASLGFGYVVTTTTAYATILTPTLAAKYQAVFYTGYPSAFSTQMTRTMEYLDAGGRFLIADNDFGYGYRNYTTTVNLYRDYFQATYDADAGSDGVITGTDIMAGIITDISSDPYPDSFTFNGADAVGLFYNKTPGTWAGERIARNSYRAVYLAWDYYYAGGSTVGDQVETEIMQRVVDWLGLQSADFIPWLTETPTQGTVSAPGQQTVALNFDASVEEVTQPGTYYGSLKIKHQDTVAGDFTVPVTMTVVPSNTQAKLNGTITGLGYCDITPTPLNGAAVSIQGAGGSTIIVYTNAAGYYQQWVDTANNPFTITVAAANHLPGVAYATAYSGVTTTTDIGLRWLQPCVNAAPTSLSVEMTMGVSTTLPLTLTNTGAASSGFTLTEKVGGVIPVLPEATFFEGFEDTTFPPADWGRYEIDGSTSYQWVRSTTTPHTGSGTAYHSYGSSSSAEDGVLIMPVLKLGAASQLIFWERTSFPGDYESGGHSIWICNANCDTPPTNYTQIVETGALTDTTWHQKTIDLSAYSYQTARLAFRYKGLYADGWYLDDVSVTNATLPDIIPWASETPLTGTLSANTGLTTVEVTFDTSVPEVDGPGIYYASLQIANADPVKAAMLYPLTMTVSAPATWAKFNGEVSTQGVCDVNPAPLNNATVFVETSTGMTYTLHSNAAGYYQLWTAAANSPLTLTVSAPGHVTAVVPGITATGGTTTTTDVKLRLYAPCQASTPDAMSASQYVGRQTTQTLIISNTGAAPLNWEINERAGAQVQTPAAIAQYAKVEAQARSAGDSAGRAEPIHIGRPEDTLLTEGFEGGVVPPTGWTRVITDSSYTWKIMTAGTPHSGSYAADVEYDPALAQQDEWLLSPEMVLNSATLSFWSLGSLYWCRDTYDNCDLNIWLVVGDVGGGDDVYVGQADASWSDSYVWSQSVFDLTPFVPANTPVHIAFQYVGVDGAQIGLDDILVEGVAGSVCTPNSLPWVTAVPVSGTTASDSASPVSVVFNSTGLLPGTYSGQLCLDSNDLIKPSSLVTVSLTVIQQYGVDVAPSTAASAGDPGAVVSYTLQVTNTGAVNDIFDLAVSGNAWNAQVSPTQVAVPAGGSAPVAVYVTVANTAMPNDTDTVTVTATSQGDALQHDAAVLTTTANQIYKMDMWSPSVTLMSDPGKSVTYTLYVSNTGNVTGTFTFGAYAYSWPMHMPGNVVIGPYGSAMVSVVVDIPAGTAGGQSDVAALQASIIEHPGSEHILILTTIANMTKIYLPIIGR